MSPVKPTFICALIAVLSLIALVTAFNSGSALAGTPDFGSSSSSGVFSGSDSAFYVGPPLDAGPEPATAPPLTASPTPEPSALVMLVPLAVFAAFRFRRRRR
jgi:MYXO-CTERM domain-containing protein